jgi:hypothetical protein
MQTDFVLYALERARASQNEMRWSITALGLPIRLDEVLADTSAEPAYWKRRADCRSGKATLSAQ